MFNKRSSTMNDYTLKNTMIIKKNQIQ